MCINLLQIPSANASAYGISLLDVIFTKEEQAKLVVFPTKKTTANNLSLLHVSSYYLVTLLYIQYVRATIIYICFVLDCMNIKYKDYDHKPLKTTLGQKCRDAHRANTSKNSNFETSD